MVEVTCSFCFERKALIIGLIRNSGRPSTSSTTARASPQGVSVNNYLVIGSDQQKGGWSCRFLE